MMKQEKQVRIENPHDMTISELQALLNRQKTFYNNKALIQNLPDKGQKIQKLIARLEHVLEEKANVDDAADLFQNLALRADESSRRVVDNSNNEDDDDDEHSILRQMVNSQHHGKMVVDESRGDGKYINTYDRILKRTEKSLEDEHKFYPYRTIKNKSLNEDMVEKLQKPELLPARPPRQSGPLCSVMEDAEDTGLQAQTQLQTQLQTQPQIPGPSGSSPVTSPLRVGRLLDLPKKEAPGTVSLKYHYDELLEGGSQSERKAQPLSIQESAELQMEQKKKHQECQAQHAGQKLAERLHVTMRSADSQFNPDGSSMIYRTTQEDSDADSDDDVEAQDYPE